MYMHSGYNFRYNIYVLTVNQRRRYSLDSEKSQFPGTKTKTFHPNLDLHLTNFLYMYMYVNYHQSSKSCVV